MGTVDAVFLLLFCISLCFFFGSQPFMCANITPSFHFFFWGGGALGLIEKDFSYFMSRCALNFPLYQCKFIDCGFLVCF